MDRPRLIGLAASVATLLALAAAAPAAALDAATLFDPTKVVVIDLQLPPASVAELEAEPDQYVEGTFALAETDGTPGGIGPFSTPLTVGIRLKGESSFRDLDGKAAFKIKFNEFVKGQKFAGLKKLTLNSMVQDPSMVRETLAYEAFRAASIAAPRTGYADVRVNGAEFGVHLNLETLDDVFLKDHFGEFEDPPQHLYEGAFGVDVTPGAAGKFAVDEGDEDERSDLEALIAALAAGSQPTFSARMSPFADLEQMTMMWAVERFVGHWDGYSGRPKPHNYYLYSDPEGAFQMLPWGTDQTWNEYLTFTGRGGVLFDECLGEGACLDLYRSSLAELGRVLPSLNQVSTARAVASLLAPWQAFEEPGRRPFSPERVAGSVEQVAEFVAARPTELASFLAGPEPPPAGPSPGAAPVAPANKRLSTQIDLDRSSLSRGILVTRIAAPGAGRLLQKGWLRTTRGRLPACAAAALSEVAGKVTLRCRLSPQARRHLGARWIRLALRTSFAAESGGERSGFGRTVRLPREA